MEKSMEIVVSLTGLEKKAEVTHAVLGLRVVRAWKRQEGSAPPFPTDHQ